MACTGHNSTCCCTGHNGTVTCTGHNGTNGCVGHTGTGNNDGGYIGPVTYTFTNVTVSAGEEIDAQNEIHELLARLKSEATRRSKSTSTLALSDPIHAVGEIRTLRDYHNYVLDKTSVSPYTDTQIVNTQPILASTIETMKDNVVAGGAVCLCNCNYACTCNCNYACTCNCHYACTCYCHYACTCNCHYCTCNCAYCTCQCAYSCTCHCHYSDIRLKTNITYF